MSRRRPVVAAVVVGVALAVAGCTDPSPERPEPEETETPAPQDEEPEVVEEDIDPEFNEADVDGAQEILALHHSSIELHEILQSKADIDGQVQTMALSLHTTHYDQGRLLQEMLQAWEADVPDPEDGAESEVVSDERVRDFGRASGDDASVLYLESMIALHEARSNISEDVLHDGENPDLADLAQELITHQQHEATHMRELLAGYDVADPDDEDAEDEDGDEEDDDEVDAGEDADEGDTSS